MWYSILVVLEALPVKSNVEAEMYLGRQCCSSPHVVVVSMTRWSCLRVVFFLFLQKVATNFSVAHFRNQWSLEDPRCR